VHRPFGTVHKTYKTSLHIRCYGFTTLNTCIQIGAESLYIVYSQTFYGRIVRVRISLTSSQL